MFSPLLLLCLILSVAFLVVFLSKAPVIRRFAVIEHKTGKVLYSRGVKPEDVFSVKYLHSVNKSPVEDFFQIQQDYSLMLKKTSFKSFGAGVPFETDPGQTLKMYEDRMEIEGIDRKLDRYLLFVGIVADHTLYFKGEEVHLDTLTAPQTTVRFEAGTYPVFSVYKLW